MYIGSPRGVLRVDVDLLVQQRLDRGQVLVAGGLHKTGVNLTRYLLI